MNPRGTHAPIRFRVGRLQPGSATPPRNVIKSLSAIHLSPPNGHWHQVQAAPSSTAPGALTAGAATIFSTTAARFPGDVERSAETCSGIASRRVPGPFASLPQPTPNRKRRYAGSRARSPHPARMPHGPGVSRPVQERSKFGRPVTVIGDQARAHGTARVCQQLCRVTLSSPAASIPFALRGRRARSPTIRTSFPPSSIPLDLAPRGRV